MPAKPRHTDHGLLWDTVKCPDESLDVWAADVSVGHDAGLYAWRRANVAALNQRARDWMQARAYTRELGRTHRPLPELLHGERYVHTSRVVSR